MVTADNGSELRLFKLRAGTAEFLSKPVDPTEFATFIANLAGLHEVRRRLADHVA